MKTFGPLSPKLFHQVAETAAEEEFFAEGDRMNAAAESVVRTREPAARPITKGSVLASGSLLSVQAGGLTPLKGFTNARFARVMDDATGSRSSTGNIVKPLFDGVSSFAERNRIIDGAKHSILLETFIFNSDETGWELANKLAAKAKQGVKVAVIYDAVGTGRADDKMFDMMRKAGVEVRVRPYTALNQRWHEKLLIVDGQTGITGGMNIANEYAYGGTGKPVLSRGDKPQLAWRDADVSVTGPMVRAMSLDFLYNLKALGGGWSDAAEEDLLSRAKPASRTGVEARFIERKSNETQSNTGMDAYFYAITAAQKSITIENAYFAPPTEVRQALIDAAKRGVKVRVLTNSPETNDIGIVQDVMRSWYKEMLEAGIEIREKTGGTVHAKTATFDGEFSFIGSLNLNQRSARLDSEDIVAITDPVTAQALEERFKTGEAESNAMTLPMVEQWSRWAQIQHRGAQILFGAIT